MPASIRNIDIVDLPADALVYSTNVFLNCSGGVGASLLGKYGDHFQKELHNLLTESGRRYAEQGTIFRHVPSGLPYQMIFHTVPCDGFYETSDEIVTDTLETALLECDSTPGISSVTMSALAAGYGRIWPVLSGELPSCRRRGVLHKGIPFPASHYLHPRPHAIPECSRSGKN